MGRVVILFGFCTAGKSTIIKHFEKYGEGLLHTRDTDTIISKDYGNHIYNIYTSFYKDYKEKYCKGIENPECNVSKFNNKDANEYIEKREREILISLTDECYRSEVPCLMAPGPFLVTRKPQWEYFENNIKPICYYIELTKEEVYKGLMERRKKLRSNKISKSKSFGCWDDGSTMKYKEGKYVALDEQTAIKNIKELMRIPVCEYEKLSKGRTFKATEIRNDYNEENRLYSSIKKDLLL